MEASQNSPLALQMSIDPITVDSPINTESSTMTSSTIDPPIIMSQTYFDLDHFQIAAALSFDSEVIPPTLPEN